MAQAREIGPGIFLVAGPDLTDPRDALTYMIEDGADLALIDAGAGPSVPNIIEGIRNAGRDPERIGMIVATHAHIDHIGGLNAFLADHDLTIVAHEEDAPAMETADPVFTAAGSYGLSLKPFEVHVKLRGRINHLALGSSELICLHTPGHTPGSMVVYLDRDGKRYLFGQDIHGPFHPAFGSNLIDWRASMQALLDLEADVLCEGHFGIYQGKEAVKAFIQSFLNEFRG